MKAYDTLDVWKKVFFMSATVEANAHFLRVHRKRSSGELSESSASSLSPDPDNLLGRRIQHTWREKGNVTKWKGTVLERLTMNSSLYMVKYDGFDCVYGIELFKDNRVSNLQLLTEKVGEWDDVRL